MIKFLYFVGMIAYACFAPYPIAWLHNAGVPFAVLMFGAIVITAALSWHVTCKVFFGRNW